MTYEKIALYFKWIDQIFYEIIILKTCLQKKNCRYIYREKEYSMKKPVNALV